MSGGLGFLGFIGIAKEVAWGTPVAATDYIEAMSESVQASMDRFATVNIRNGYEEPSDEAGILRIGGDIALSGNPVSIGNFLKGALQTKSVSIVASGALWTNHFFSIKKGDEFSADVSHQPYTVEIFRDVTTSVQYAGMCVDSLAINFQPNQDVRFTATLIGKDEANLVASTPTFPSSPTTPFRFDTSSIQIGGAANAKMESLTIEIANNLTGVPRLNGTDKIAAIRMSDFQMINITGSLEFSSTDEYDDFIAQSEQALIVSVTKANSFAMTIDIPKMVYTAFPTGIGGRERQTVDFTGKGFYHAGSGTMIQIDLTTTSSAY